MASERKQQKAAYRKAYQALDRENRQLMDAMAAYIRESDVTRAEGFGICAKLAQKLLRAQTQGQPAEQVLGRDLKGVCDTYIRLGRKKTAAAKRAELLEGCLLGLVVLVALELVFTGAWRGLFDFQVRMPVTQGFLLSTALILGFAWLLVTLLAKHSFGFADRRQGWRSAGVMLLCTALWVLIVLAKWALRQNVLCWVNAWAPLALVAALFAIAEAIRHKNG